MDDVVVLVVLQWRFIKMQGYLPFNGIKCVNVTFPR